MNSRYSVAGHWAGGFDETGLQKWAEELRTKLEAPKASLGLVFMAPKFFGQAAQILELLRVHARIPILLGCSSHSLIAGSEEIEEEAGLALGLYHLPGAVLKPFDFTKAERNFIHEIANRPAYEVLAETFSNLSADEQQKTRGNLFVGLVMNEYLDEFHRGDFLIRNLIGADPKTGTLAVGAYPRPGQTIQFQRRDAATGTEDMTSLLQKLRDQIKDRPVYGACLCSCNGRGHRLFGEHNHDARHVQEYIGPTGLTGFFCNGEIGPVGDQNYLHGYTASVGVFVKKT